MPRRDGLRIWKVLKKFQLRSDLGVGKLRSDYGVEKLGSDQVVEDLRLDHAGRQLSFCHWVEFSTLAAAVTFFGSRPAKMNWDLKHHEICRTLGVLLAQYDYERLLRIASILVSKNRSQVIDKPFVPEQRSPLVHLYCVACICILVLYNTLCLLRNLMMMMIYLTRLYKKVSQKHLSKSLLNRWRQRLLRHCHWNLSKKYVNIIFAYLCQGYILGTSMNLIKQNSFTLEKSTSRRYPIKTKTDADYADDLALLANTPTQAESLVHNPDDNDTYNKTDNNDPSGRRYLLRSTL